MGQRGEPLFNDCASPLRDLSDKANKFVAISCRKPRKHRAAGVDLGSA